MITFRGMVFLFLFFLVPAAAHAGYDYKMDTREVKMGQFESEMAGKITRGIINTAFGWTELARTPIQMAHDPHSASLFKALVLGIPYGAIRAVGRTVVGVFEIVTFYAPQPPIFAPLEGSIV